MIEYVVKYGQTLTDIAIEKYGCEEGVIILLQDNNLSFVSDLTPGQKILTRDKVPQLNVNNQAIAAYILSNKIGIASGVVEVETPTPTGGFYEDNFFDNEFFD